MGSSKYSNTEAYVGTDRDPRILYPTNGVCFSTWDPILRVMDPMSRLLFVYTRSNCFSCMTSILP
jgi:hypothetical protein